MLMLQLLQHPSITAVAVEEEVSLSVSGLKFSNSNINSTLDIESAMEVSQKAEEFIRQKQLEQPSHVTHTNTTNVTAELTTSTIHDKTYIDDKQVASNQQKPAPTATHHDNTPNKTTAIKST